MSDHAQPIGGRVWTTAFKVLVILGAIASLIVVVRLFLGLGAVGAMNDGYSWGIWKPFNVVTFTGVGAGAFGMAILCYVLNKGEYHPLVRSSVVVGAWAYTLGGMSVMVDLGRWWNIWKLARIWTWNLNSVLLEIAVCVMAYTGVLWVELAPAILERFAEAPQPVVRNLARTALPKVKAVLPFVIALAILLPLMHQSSLGTLMMIAMHRVHGLWHTPFLPLLFLISCAFMGYAGVVMENTLASIFFKRRIETEMLARLAKVMVGLVAAYVAIRVPDLAVHGKFALLGADRHTALFLVEMALFIVPAVLLLSKEWRENPGKRLGGALLFIAGGALYRFDTYLINFDPGPGYHYFPSIFEILMSLGLIAVGTTGYVVLVRFFPILAGSAPARPSVPPSTIAAVR